MHNFVYNSDLIRANIRLQIFIRNNNDDRDY